MEAIDLFNMLKFEKYRKNLIEDLKVFFQKTHHYPLNEGVKMDEYFTLDFYKKSSGWRNVFQFVTRSSDSATHLHGTISQDKMYLPNFYFENEQKEFDDILKKYHRDFMLSQLLEE